MNKERLDTVVLTYEILAGMPRTRRLPRLIRPVKKGLTAVLKSEQRSARAMEPYKDSPGSTPINYARSVRAIGLLEEALACLEDHDLDGASDALGEVLGSA